MAICQRKQSITKLDKTGGERSMYVQIHTCHLTLGIPGTINQSFASPRSFFQPPLILCKETSRYIAPFRAMYAIAPKTLSQILSIILPSWRTDNVLSIISNISVPWKRKLKMQLTDFLRSHIWKEANASIKVFSESLPYGICCWGKCKKGQKKTKTKSVEPLKSKCLYFATLISF